MLKKIQNKKQTQTVDLHDYFNETANNNILYKASVFLLGLSQIHIILWPTYSHSDDNSGAHSEIYKG